MASRRRRKDVVEALDETETLEQKREVPSPACADALGKIFGGLNRELKETK